MVTNTIMEEALSTAIKRKKSKQPQTFFEREFPDGPGVKLVKVGVADAYEILRNNPDNRSLSEVKVEQYASDLKEGRWALNGETIKITADGVLNDGQHRLEAIIKAQTPMETIIIYGVGRDTRYTVDQGRPRGAGCYISMQGIPSGNQIAAVARMMMSYNANFGRSVSSEYGWSNAQVLEYVNKHIDELTEAVRFAGSAPRSAHGVSSKGLFAFWYMLLKHKAGDLGTQYIRQVMTGEDLSMDDPAYRVRERLVGMSRTSRQASTEVVLRGWIHYRDGKPFKIIKIMGELPKV